MRHADKSFRPAVLLVRDLGPHGTPTVAGGFLAITDDSAVASPTNDDLDYRVSALDLQHRFQASGVSATIGASFYHNFEDGPASDPVRDATDGVAAFARLGRFTEPGDLEVAYYFAEMEKYAVAPFSPRMTGSDSGTPPRRAPATTAATRFASPACGARTSTSSAVRIWSRRSATASARTACGST